MEVHLFPGATPSGRIPTARPQPCTPTAVHAQTDVLLSTGPRPSSLPPQSEGAALRPGSLVSVLAPWRPPRLLGVLPASETRRLEAAPHLCVSCLRRWPSGRHSPLSGSLHADPSGRWKAPGAAGARPGQPGRREHPGRDKSTCGFDIFAVLKCSC